MLKSTTINSSQPISQLVNNNIVISETIQATYSKNRLLLDTEDSSNYKPPMAKDHRQLYNQQLNDTTLVKDNHQ